MSADPVRAAIAIRLLADSALTGKLAAPTSVHFRQIPSSGKLPAVVFQRQADTTSYTFDDHTDDTLWLVKGVCTGGSPTVAEEIAGQIRVTLHRAALPVAGRQLLVVKRLSGVSYGETVDGQQFHHEGHLFQVLSQPA